MARLSLLMLLALVVTLDLASGRSRRREYENDYDKDLDFQCPKNQVLSEIYSIHSNQKEDRKSDLKCKPLTVSNCKWDKFPTVYDRNWREICYGKGVLAGIKSEHSNQHEDRKFRFLCCSPAKKPRYCRWSKWTNYDQEIDYKVPKGKVITGMMSFHSNNYEDRRFKFRECSI